MRPSILYIVQLLYMGTAVGDGFVAIGDWGADSEEQYATARAMSDWCQRESCRFVVSTGDNFYPDGLTSSEDPRFNSTWKIVYDLPALEGLTWIVALGNHDYGKDGREFEQVKYSAINPRWRLPHLWHETPLNLDGTTLHLIVLDTMAIVGGKNEHEKQIDWLDRVLTRSESVWKIAIGHHPPSQGGYGAPGHKKVRDLVVPLLERHRVDVMLTGHDHNLQHVSRSDEPGDSYRLDHVISGGGGKALYKPQNWGKAMLEEQGYRLRFFAKVFGFVHFDIGQAEMRVRYVASTGERSGEVVYNFTRRKEAEGEKEVEKKERVEKDEKREESGDAGPKKDGKVEKRKEEVAEASKEACPVFGVLSLAFLCSLVLPTTGMSFEL